jgi:hypothetical protein
MGAHDDRGLTRRQLLAGAAGLGLGAWAAARFPDDGCSTTPARGAAAVDASSFSKKLMFGYQGWFGTPDDGSAMDQWQHWCAWGTAPRAGTMTVDLWPDLSGFSRRQLTDSGLTYPDGTPAYLFSSYRPDIVAAHFRWMRTYGIDGVFLQQFVTTLAPGSALRQFRDRVTQNVVRAAEATGRVFAVMYDVSGAEPGMLVRRVESHWAAMEPRVVRSPRYLHHRGRPLVALWGLGFAGPDYPAVPERAHDLLDFFARRHVTVMGGVPTYWRQGIRDSKPGPEWAAVFRRFAIISPWTGSRYSDRATAIQYARLVLAADVAEAARVEADLVPVVFPGFSAHNQQTIAGDTVPPPAFNSIPRHAGAFWWAQMKAFQEVGVKTVYGAMFDEVDEGTAMFKMAATTARLPVEPSLVPLDADGYSLPSDWYLRLAGAATVRLRRGAAFEPVPPLTLPGGAQWPTPVPVPIITSVAPSVASAGQHVTVSGMDFGAVQGRGYVSFGDEGIAWGSSGCAATFSLNSWSDDRITFTVPTPSGPDGVYHVVPGTEAIITVTNDERQESNDATLTIGLA